MKPNPSWVITGDHCFICALSDATMTTNSTLRCARRQVRARWCPRRPSQRPSLPTTTPSLHLVCVVHTMRYTCPGPCSSPAGRHPFSCPWPSRASKATFTMHIHQKLQDAVSRGRDTWLCAIAFATPGRTALPSLPWQRTFSGRPSSRQPCPSTSRKLACRWPTFRAGTA